MRTRNRIALAAAALLAFTFAGAARADDNEAWRDHYPDWTDGRGDDGRYHDERYRPDPRRITALAHDVESTATSIHRRFERNNRRPNRDEVRVMRQLHRLEQSAARFHSQVERPGNGYGYLRRDFRTLEDSFWDTSRSLRSIGRRDYVDRGMQRIAYMLRELGPTFGRGGDGRYSRDYGEGDHGRYGDRDRRWDDDRYDRDDRRR